VGGDRAGSAGLIYALDTDGQRLFTTPTGRARRPWPIGWPFVQHTLDVTELYVRLREAERTGVVQLLRFDAEPDSWQQINGWRLKPDAYLVVADADWERHTWVEVDRDTESLPTLRRKLLSYVQAAAAGAVAPLGVMPQVLVTVPNQARQLAVEQVVAHLPAPANDLITVEQFTSALLLGPRSPPQRSYSHGNN
jgi:hypothetical protein